MSDAATGFQPDWVSRPADTICALMGKSGLSVHDIAEKFDADEYLIHELITGVRGIDNQAASLLSAALGGAPSFWLQRQRIYDERLKKAAESEAGEQAKAWVRQLPVKHLADAGWIKRPASWCETYQQLLAFFDVDEPGTWSRHYGRLLDQYAFRTSSTLTSSFAATATWLRLGELQAQKIQCAPWDADRLRDRLVSLRALSKVKDPRVFIPQIRKLCAQCGVAVVFVRAPSGCRASGATKFLSPQKAMVILSFRFLSDDHFWFTFFHELGHILLHGEEDVFVEGGEDINDQLAEKENEANVFASSLLVSVGEMRRLSGGRPQAREVIRAAVSLGISPGILVGQLQFNGFIGFNQLNSLKRRYQWDDVIAAFSP